MSSFELNSSFKPSGDQEQAIGKLLKSLEAGNKHQGLLGVTGSGKTFTMANLIARMNRPHAGDFPQQDARRAASLGAEKLFPE